MVDDEAYSLWGVTPFSLIYCIGTDILRYTSLLFWSV